MQSQDEIDLPKEWQQFIKDHELDAVVCIASAIKRGILNESESQRYEKLGSNLSDSMDLSGLGQWIEAVNNADQQIVFGY